MFFLFFVLALMACGRVVASLARAKGYNGCLFALMFLPLGIAGVLGGSAALGAVSATLSDDGRPNLLLLFVGGLLGLSSGTAIALLIFKTLPPVHRPNEVRAREESEGW
jgi:hypothetical protein